MGLVVEPGNAVAFWDARYADAMIYGTEPTSVAHREWRIIARKIRAC